MKTTRTRLKYTTRARHDLDYCRKFLRRKTGGRAQHRTRDILSAVRLLQERPLLYPVIGLSLSGLELRRRNVGQFVILYTYFEPTSAEPHGVVSIRAIPHAGREDVLSGVHEPGRNETERVTPAVLR